MLRTSLVLSVALVLAACGEAPGNLDGTIGKNAFTVRDAVLLGGRDARGNLDALGVVLSDQPGLCEALKAGKVEASTLELLLTSGGAAPGVGAYAVGAAMGNRAQAQGRPLGKTPVLAVSGAVSVAQLETGNRAFIAGSFDLTFDSQEHARGSFHAPVCLVAPSFGIQKVEDHQLPFCDALEAFTTRFYAKHTECIPSGSTMPFDRATCEKAAVSCSADDRARTEALISCFDALEPCTMATIMQFATGALRCTPTGGMSSACGF
ncbi:MAG: hypothetical protein K1X89_00680 [Myxococcaceae bacterium]|nr:hypothetical protein [Myxococcaceae bacterium]